MTECGVCGRVFELPTGYLYNAGPSTLCDQHYAEWFHYFDAQLKTGTSSDDSWQLACEKVGWL